MRPLLLLAALGLLWTGAVAADQQDSGQDSGLLPVPREEVREVVRAQETKCYETRGPDAKHPWRRIGQEVPCPELEVGILAGGLVAASSTAESSLWPTLVFRAGLPLASWQKPPRLLPALSLSALPGETIGASAPETWRAVEFRVGLAQPVHDTVNLDLYLEAGFATRLPGELEARDRTARWAAAGVRVGRFSGGWLHLLLGGDQRLDGQWRPAVLVEGALRLHDGGEADVYLVGNAVLGLQWYGQAPRDVVRVGLAVGR